MSNWYSVEIEPLPLPLARIICQRTNCWWDSDVRRRYATKVTWGVIGLTIFVAFLGLFRNENFADWLASALAPTLPIMIWGCRQIREQNETASKLDKLREHAEKLWNQILDEALSVQYIESRASELQSKARELQDKIFDHRCTSQPMFDKIHRLCRDEMESHMNQSAKYYAEQASSEFNCSD